MTEAKVYIYGLFCIVSEDQYGIKRAKMEWSRECRMGYCDTEKGTYGIPNTIFEGYVDMQNYMVTYDPDDGYGAVLVDLPTLDSNYMEEFKEEATKRALGKLILKLDEERNKNEHN